MHPTIQLNYFPQIKEFTNKTNIYNFEIQRFRYEILYINIYSIMWKMMKFLIY